jgi:ABC-type microcin C transport system permease subunit YejB
LDKVKFTLDNPLVDVNFNPIEDASNEFIRMTQDEFTNYEVTINVNSLDMAATAMFFSMRKRPNVEFIAKIKDFIGADFFESFLRSGHILEVINE